MSLLSKPTRPTLYHATYWSSSRPAAVIMELKLLAADQEIPVDIVHVTDEQVKKDPMLIKLNPQKRLPFFYDPKLNLSLNESGGLVQYLLEKYDSKGKLSPFTIDNDPIRRAEFLKLIHFGPASIYHIGVPIFGHSMGFAPLEEKELESKKEEWNRIVVPTLEHALTKFEGPYLLGSQFTAADCVIGYDLLTISSSSFAEELLYSHPKLKAYMDTMKERPVYQKLYSEAKDEEESREADMEKKRTVEGTITSEAKKVKA